MKTNKMVILIAFILLGLCFSACSAETRPSPSPSAQRIESPEPPPSPDHTPQVTDEQAAKLYAEALRVWEWFGYPEVIKPLAVDYDDAKEIDGYWYIRVTDNSIQTYAELESRVHSIFGSEIADRLLDNEQQFKDIDGSLYIRDTAGGSVVAKAFQSAEVLVESGQKFIYRIMYDMREDLDDGESRMGEKQDQVFELIDGAWKCTKFEYIPILDDTLLTSE